MKVVIFGLGSIGRRHLSIIKNIYPNVDIYAYRSKKVKEEDGIINIYDINEIFRYKPDIAFITNPTSLHIDIALLAAKKGCHLFIEKPLSNSLDKVEELISVVKELKLITLMGCNMRFNPIILEVKKYVDKKLFGDILSFSINCGSYLPEWRPWQDYTKSYSALKKLGGGVVLDLIHEVDYAKWIFGDFTEVKSLVGKISDLNIETEDYANIILKTSENILGFIHLDYYRKMPKREIEIVFENGILIGDLINNELRFITKEQKKDIKFSFDVNYMYEEQIKYFIQSIKEQKKTFNDVEEGYSVLKLALKIKSNGLVGR